MGTVVSLVGKVLGAETERFDWWRPCLQGRCMVKMESENSCMGASSQLLAPRKPSCTATDVYELSTKQTSPRVQSAPPARWQSNDNHHSFISTPAGTHIIRQYQTGRKTWTCTCGLRSITDTGQTEDEIEHIMQQPQPKAQMQQLQAIFVHCCDAVLNCELLLRCSRTTFRSWRCPTGDVFRRHAGKAQRVSTSFSLNKGSRTCLILSTMTTSSWSRSSWPDSLVCRERVHSKSDHVAWSDVRFPPRG